jgi:hypothetical protein
VSRQQRDQCESQDPGLREGTHQAETDRRVAVGGDSRSGPEVGRNRVRPPARICFDREGPDDLLTQSEVSVPVDPKALVPARREPEVRPIPLDEGERQTGAVHDLGRERLYQPVLRLGRRGEHETVTLDDFELLALSGDDLPSPLHTCFHQLDRDLVDESKVREPLLPGPRSRVGEVAIVEDRVEVTYGPLFHQLDDAVELVLRRERRECQGRLLIQAVPPPPPPPTRTSLGLDRA